MKDGTLKKIVNWVPNFLSLLRIFLCPIILTLMLKRQFVPALAVYSVAALSDLIDGWWARRWNCISRLGAILDPIADKLFSLSFFICLAVLAVCPLWFLGLVFSVHLLQLVGFCALNYLKIGTRSPFDPLKIGKFNTALQLVWIGWQIMQLEWSRLGHLPLGRPVTWIDSSGYIFLGILQVIVFLSYFFHFRVHLSPDFRTLFPMSRS